jgi:hypothetical protein
MGNKKEADKISFLATSVELGTMHAQRCKLFENFCGSLTFRLISIFAFSGQKFLFGN